jgi:hypothetical protein
MGSRDKNFYNDICRAYGFEREAAEIQDLYLNGRKREAEALVPEELLGWIHLVGPAGHIRERLSAYAEAGVTTLLANPVGVDPVQTIAALRTLVDEIR